MFLVLYIIGVLLLIGFLVALAIVQAIGEHQDNLEAQRRSHHRVG
jgi:hypothetical protein